MTKILIDEAAVRLALAALELVTWTNNPPVNKAITALRQALADAALDKMAGNAKELGLSYMECSAKQYEKELEKPAQPWVGLTDDELADLWYKQSLDWMEFANAVIDAFCAKNGITKGGE
jgi:hypothetical protein